jgi:hypothetical protein
MAAIVARYTVIVIGNVRLLVGGAASRTFKFTLPAGATQRFPVVVTFLLAYSNDLHMRVELNGALVSDRRYTNGPERRIQDLASVPLEDLGNNMIFTVLQGEVVFKDVVMWFQYGSNLLVGHDNWGPTEGEIGEPPRVSGPSLRDE